jgi:hypothetical protein
MIRKLRKLLFPPPRLSGRKMFNRDLLEQQREDVFVLMHQQMGGLR